MKILLDTCVALWLLGDNEKLSIDTKRLLLNGDNIVYYSIASAWEVGIKHKKRQDIFYVSAEEFLQHCDDMGCVQLSINAEHIKEFENIDCIHNDPFDRLLLAQAKYEDMYFLTDDAKLLTYNYDKIIKA